MNRTEFPFGVVVGDSISEGHPGRHGRLHPNEEQFIPDFPDQPGQLSYELSRLVGFRFLNQGIGGQTSDQIWQRWSRDVLAEQFDPGDGRGARTLERKPNIVYVHAGINDLYYLPLEDATATHNLTLTRTTLNTIRDNMIRMAESAARHDIIVLFGNLGPYDNMGQDRYQTIVELNGWMASELPARGAKVVDYRSWAEDPHQPGEIDRSKFADEIHPSPEGYRSYAKEIAKVIAQAIALPGDAAIPAIGESWADISR